MATTKKKTKKQAVTTRRTTGGARRTTADEARAGAEREAMFRLAEAAEGDVSRRWSLAWKVDMIIWFALLALSVYTMDKNVRLAWSISGCILLATLWCAYVFIWIRGMHIANARDWETARLYRAEIEKSLKEGKERFGEDGTATAWLPKFLEKPMGKLPAYLTCWWSLTRISLTTLAVVLMVLALVI